MSYTFDYKPTQTEELLLAGVAKVIDVLETPPEPKLLQCTQCKQIYPDKGANFVTHYGLPTCFYCDDKMEEYRQDAKRDEYEHRNPPQYRDEDPGEEVRDESDEEDER